MKTIRLILYMFLLGIASLPGRGNNPPADCDADFEFSYVPTTPIHVQFTDISTGDPTSWFWDFGDGNTSSEQNPVHPYPEPGMYEVCLIIEHDVPPNYCSDTICKMVEIPDTVACEAIYSYSIDPLFPLEVTFFDHSVGNITNWEWNFGDGSTSFEQNPIHIFPDPGEFLVCLNVYNADSMESCFHFICETIDIPDTMTCIAEFAIVADSSSMVMNHFSFYDQSNGYPDNWFWEFGDGSFSTEQHPTHVYAEPGLYEVCLNSWNSSFPYCNDIRCKLAQTPSYYKLGGQAFIGETPINNPYHTGDTGMAILYRQRSDMGLVAVDTNIFFEHGYFWFSDMMELPYVIKIGLTEGSANFDAVVPSYYPSMMLWQDAASVMLDEDNFESHTSLLETIELETGPGGIKGRIIDDKRWELIHTRGFSDVPVILTDMLSQPLGWTRANTNGQFTFNNIAYGSYLVYADLTGMYSLPETVILSEDYPLVDSIFIEMSLTPLLSIREPEQRMFDILALYPNPAKSSINLNISAEENAGIEIMVYNQLGQQMLGENHMIYKGENKLEINISNLPESIYFLRLQAVNGTPLMKTFIKVD
ncbi:MAG: hypothetical protein DRI83_04520 [Bacteroidetes bacterium]|nr:MAG: hypothetical protein DRI83_04520 [Bacteroidota bacterium]